MTDIILAKFQNSIFTSFYQNLNLQAVTDAFWLGYDILAEALEYIGESF